MPINNPNLYTEFDESTSGMWKVKYYAYEALNRKMLSKLIDEKFNK